MPPTLASPTDQQVVKNAERNEDADNKAAE